MAKEEARLVMDGISDCCEANSLEKFISAMRGVYFAKMDLDNQTLAVWYNSEVLSLDSLKEELNDQGFTLK